MSDPTRPLAQRTPDEIGAYADDHLIMALAAAEHLTSDRQTAEDYVRDRLVAISDSWPTHDDLVTEETRRRMTRLRDVLTHREGQS